MNNSYLFFKKQKPNKSSKPPPSTSTKSILSSKLNHSVSNSSNHSNYNKSQHKIKKQTNKTLTKRQREIRQAIQYRFQKSKLKHFLYKQQVNGQQSYFQQSQRPSSHSSEYQQFKNLKKLSTVNLYTYHENKAKLSGRKIKAQDIDKYLLKHKRQNSQSPASKIQSRFKTKSNVKSENSDNSLHKNMKSIKDIYMNSILNLASKITVKDKNNHYMSQKRHDLSLKDKFNRIQKLDKTTKNGSDWKSILIRLKDSKSSLKDNKNIYSYRQNAKCPNSRKHLIQNGTADVTQYNHKNIKSFKNLNYSQDRSKDELYKLEKIGNNIQLDIEKSNQFYQFSDSYENEQKLKRNLNSIKKEHSKEVSKILEKSYKATKSPK